MVEYRRLDVYEREDVALGLAQGRSQREIAAWLGRAPSTICREIRRNTEYGEHYRALHAQSRSNILSHTARKKRKLDINEPLKQHVFKQLSQLCSPEQIAKRLKILYPIDMAMRISHESIYSYLYVHPRGVLRKELVKCLRRRHINRRIKDKIRQKTSPIQDFISIDQRPKEVADRAVPGHWEGDLLMGQGNGSALGTLVERTTRLTILVPLKNKDATSVREAFARKFSHLPMALKRSLTYDNGQEMAQHKLFTENTRIQVYFAHPHSPWERGTNENTNSLIRQFFPKGTDFSKVSLKSIKRAQDMLNDRPRKVLNFLTPYEVFNGLLH